MIASTRREALSLAARFAAVTPLAVTGDAMAQNLDAAANAGTVGVASVLVKPGHVMIPAGIYRLDAPMRLPGFFDIVGQGDAVLTGHSPGAWLTVSSNAEGAQVARSARIAGIRLQGESGARRIGTGLRVENNAALVLRDVGVQGAAIGFQFDRAQFLELDGLRAVENDIGIDCRPSPRDGGANSLTFLHPVIASNSVGMLVDNRGNNLPQGDLVLVNPQFLSNRVCALAVIGSGTRLRSQVYIYGCAPEQNGTVTSGMPSYDHGDLSIPRCSIFARFARLSIIGGTIGEYGSTDPCIVLEGATLSLHDVDGYGGPDGVVVKADRDSSVVISGCYGLTGTCHGVVAFHGHLDQPTTRGLLAGPLRRQPDGRIGVVRPGGDREAWGNAVRGATVGDVDQAGEACTVAFAPTPGDSERNAFRMPLWMPGAHERVMVRLEVEANRDTRLALCLYPNEGTVHVELAASRPTLLCFWANDVRNVTGLFILYPRDGDAPVVKIRNVRVLAGQLDDPQFVADCNLLCGG